MECEPAVSADNASVACPALNVPLPMVLVPSRNFTVPLGVPPVPVTAAVNVTESPTVDGFSDDVRTVVVASPFTVCVKAAETLPPNVVSPE